MQMAVARILKGGRAHGFAVDVPHSGSIIGFSTIFYNKVTPHQVPDILVYIFHVGVMDVSHRTHLKNAIIVRPFERLVDWRRIAIFLRNDEVADAPAILRNITEEAGSTEHMKSYGPTTMLVVGV